MRKAFTTCLLLSCFFTAISQQNKIVTPTLSQTDYLKKSKKQKITGFIMLGAGITCFALASQADDRGFLGGPGPRAAWIIVGIIPTIIGIDQLVKAGKNKRRALALAK